MKTYAVVVLSLFLFHITCITVNAQDKEQKSTPETFEMVWEGQPITMQKYFVIFLKKGPHRDQPEEEAKKIQADHLAYLGGLFKEGILNMNGPVGDDSDIAGISVYNTATIEEAIKLAKADPTVKAGRLTVEAHPWWLSKNSSVK